MSRSALGSPAGVAARPTWLDTRWTRPTFPRTCSARGWTQLRESVAHGSRLLYILRDGKTCNRRACQNCFAGPGLGATSIEPIHAHVAQYADPDTQGVMGTRIAFPDHAELALDTQVHETQWHASCRRLGRRGHGMKKTSKKQLVLKRNTLKALTELPNTVYRHVVGGGRDHTTPGAGCNGNARSIAGLASEFDETVL